MSRRTLLALLVLTLLSIATGLLISRRMASQRAVSLEKTRLAKKSAERANRLRAWEKVKPVSLTSSSLVDQLALLEEDGRIPQSEWAERVPRGALSNPQQEDLHQAIAGMLRAYAHNSPQALVEYMRARHMRLAPARRRILEASLQGQKQGSSVPMEGLSDEDLYQRYWEARGIRCRQATLLPTASQIAIWKWKHADAAQILDATAFSRLREIPEVWLGYMQVASNFAPTEPHTLIAQLRAKPEVLIADVELVIGHDKESLYQKVPYMARFWFNEAHGQWQPLMLLAAHTSGGAFPSFADILF